MCVRREWPTCQSVSLQSLLSLKKWQVLSKYLFWHEFGIYPNVLQKNTKVIIIINK